ncbi:6-phosphogluconate dehydrogenase NAD-binding [Methylocella silvestris BL2]|uniref:6-phosphogluconate dehydrogenase NAD-binding n=1 Tax=Methylocella silvestris (strain DSM 15510 / CIP 108128 / LMG 27833 / NCIMB 13906 / BL2) TaxID=395965 RepID=B8EQ31_METSB|nr:NAD(P)-dependent oxidoreductase [Methylocella silvestris]ACK51521.1 6-phosphogluconate dehydrogenase NAD-binding [Methylocella silvestris BL2]
MHIAFLGLGNMGSAMVRNLVKNGHRVVAWNRSYEPTKPIHALGVAIERTPADACKDADIAITMLADDGAAEAVTLGKDGLIEGLAEGAVHVSMSTISVALSDKFTEAHAARGQLYAAAPVFGRPEAAEAQKLFIAAAGKPDAIAKITPALESVGQKIFVMGEEPAQANLVKLTGNFLITCVIESLAEAFALTAKGGIETQKVFELLTESLFSAPVYKTYGGLILEGKFSPPGFKMPLGQKDNRLLQQAAEKLEVPLPFAAIIRDRFLAARANGDSELDWSAIAKRAAEDAGFEVK